MPYIITTIRGDACEDACQHPNLDHAADGEPCRDSMGRVLGRHAVATLDEAREAVLDVCEGRVATYTIDPEPENGGTVELPDGTVIWVERVDWEVFARVLAPLRGALIATALTDDEKQEQIDAYNSREA